MNDNNENFRFGQKVLKIPINGEEIHTEKGGDYTGKCYKCGSRNLWDDNSAYGCNDCGMLRCFG